MSLCNDAGGAGVASRLLSKKINSVAIAGYIFKKERELLAPFLYLCHHRRAFLAELTEPWLFAHHLYDNHGQSFQLQCVSKTALELKNRHISWRICHRLMRMRCLILFLDSHTRAILGRLEVKLILPQERKSCEFLYTLPRAHR